MVALIIQYARPEDVHKILLCRDRSGKTALEWALQNGDKSSKADILRAERKCHKFKEDALFCLHSQLTHEENLKLTIDQLADLYEKTTKETTRDEF